MTTIDWKQKLSSRKFWIGMVLIIVGIVLCCLGNTTDGLTIISIGAISYLGAEGLVDIFRIVFSSAFFNHTETYDEPQEVSTAENYTLPAEDTADNTGGVTV